MASLFRVLRSNLIQCDGVAILSPSVLNVTVDTPVRPDRDSQIQCTNTTSTRFWSWDSELRHALRYESSIFILAYREGRLYHPSVDT